MIQLKTNELKSFLSLSSSITQNNILPILQYLKLSNGGLEKTNHKTFVSQKIDAPKDASLLLDEKVLSAFLRDCKSSEIDVEVKGKKVTLSEGGKRPLSFQMPSVSEFPIFPESEKENETELTSEAMEAFGIAAKNTGNIGGNETFDFVHCHKGYVVGTNRAVLYAKKCDVPDMIIDKETAGILSKFGSAVFYVKGNRYFYEIGNTLYSFQMYGDVKTNPVMHDFIPKARAKEWMQFDVSELVGFCDTVMAASPSKVLDCTLRGNELKFVDAERDMDYCIEMEVQGDFKPQMNFSATTFGSYFKSLGVSSVILAPSTVNNESLQVFSDDDLEFCGVVIGLVPQ